MKFIKKMLFGVLWSSILSLQVYANSGCVPDLVDILDSGFEANLTPSEIEHALELGYTTGKDLIKYVGSPEQKAKRYAEYLVRSKNGETKNWSYSRWSAVYDANQTRAKTASEYVSEYRKKLGWGEEEVPIANLPFEKGRRLDIADEIMKMGVEVKTGYQSYSMHLRHQIEVDSYLIKERGWRISWYFDGPPTKPLLDALDRAGISYKFRLPEFDKRL